MQLVLMLLLFMIPGCQQPLQKFEFIRPKMGTGFRVVLYAPNTTTANRAAEAVFARVDQLNATLSDYDPNSEISKLSQMTNTGPMPEPVHVSDDLWEMLRSSVEASQLSDGAFDITVGPFVRLWRRSRDMHELPTPERVAEAKKSVGYRYLKLDPVHHTTQLLAPKMRLDVGGIAKGYTAMECLKLLKSIGINRAMVGAAGDLAVGDPPPGKDYWRVGIQSLEKPDDIAAYVNLRNYFAGTSGDTYRVIELDGKRYSHIIDPQTGLGMTRRIGVTALAPDGTTSDWLSLAVSVLGPEKGLALVDRLPGCAARVIVLEGDHSRVFESARFRAFLDEP